MADVLAPLYNLLQKDAHWRWTRIDEKAFRASKELLTSSTLLVHFDPELDLLLMCDASSYGLGAVLVHRMPDGTERPIGYASRSLTPSQRNYSQIEKEALALVFGVQRFHAYLYGHRFELVTDTNHCLLCCISTDPLLNQLKLLLASDDGPCCSRRTSTPLHSEIP